MDKIYRNKKEFNRMSLINISEAGRFAADRSIKEYAENIWNISKVE
jgi:starch phosphorylase